MKPETPHPIRPGGPIAQACYFDAIARRGPAGLARSEFGNLSVPGRGQLRSADRDATLELMEAAGRIERFEVHKPQGPVAVCWRATERGLENHTPAERPRAQRKGPAGPSAYTMAQVARTDGLLLSAAETLATGPPCSNADLARAAGVDPHTAKKGVRRLREAGRWPYRLPMAHVNRGKKPAGQTSAVRLDRRPRAAVAAMERGRAASSYLLHGDPWRTTAADPKAIEAAKALEEYRAARRRVTA